MCKSDSFGLNIEIRFYSMRAVYCMCKPYTDSPDETTKQEKTFDFPSTPLYYTPYEQKQWISCYCARFGCAGFYVRLIRLSVIVDSVTTIRARINCTQREKCSMCLKTMQRRISFAHPCPLLFKRPWHNIQKWQQFRYSTCVAWTKRQFSCWTLAFVHILNCNERLFFVMKKNLYYCWILRKKIG